MIRVVIAGGFDPIHREVITTSKDLASRLADLARRIRRRADSVLTFETEKGQLRKLYKAFQEALIHDLNEDDFADMYAQTIAYGLLAAHVSRPMGVTAGNLADMIPITNPFLKEMLGTFLTAGGRKGAIDFDELGVQEVVELLNSPDTHMDAILRDFGNRTQQEDPVIHFYEDFLSEYDKTKKVQRGVFFTPQPVVSYIVRSVHELLQSEFGLEDGLADITTWGEMVKRKPGIHIPEGVSPNEPFVQILDPATGTATFLVEVIDLIYKTMRAKWMKQGYMALEVQSLWNEYVPKHLLPRLYGFELMMAPYAIAHMKFGLKLYETGYQFGSNERVRVYLTNTLEPAQRQIRYEGIIPALAHEAEAVNAIKRDQRFTVVIGNPPYAGISSNKSEHAVQLVDAFKTVDGKRLAEKKLWLQDDYVKFIRFGQTTIELASCGILGYITNHGYLDNPTFRGMRQSLLSSFQTCQIVNLHGNTKKKETAPDGSPDVNVFDIQQGVAIGLFIRHAGAEEVSHSVSRGDLYGNRESKYAALLESSSDSLPMLQLQPNSPLYLFLKQDQTYREEYETMPSLSEITHIHSVGVVTARDHLTIAFYPNEIWDRVNRFSMLDENKARIEFGLRQDVRDWKVSLAQSDLRTQPLSESKILPILYRPFDIRSTYYTGKIKGFIGQPASAIMANMIGKDNIGLMTTRKVEVGEFGHAIVANTMTESHCVSLKEVNYLFPLWIYPKSQNLTFTGQRTPNFTPKFLKEIAESLSSRRESPRRASQDITAEQVFRYAYSVLHSPSYRTRYSEFLKTDFPRIPLVYNQELFSILTQLGSELIALHLMESPKLNEQATTLVGSGDYRVDKVSYSNETVWIDIGTKGFRGVPENVWNFHIGGYQVCHKWLKDRKGRVLSAEDITHYQKIVVALNETIRLMEEIDEVIEEHGGWPGAFVAGDK